MGQEQTVDRVNRIDLQVASLKPYRKELNFCGAEVGPGGWSFLTSGVPQGWMFFSLLFI